MTQTIENEFLKVKVNDHGAELCSIFDKEKNREVLWQADPKYWKRYAPVLFPNVGRHYEDTYRVHGKEYTTGQHGFARDSEFVCTELKETSVTHVLKSSAETLTRYPFEFEFAVTHVLEGRSIRVCWAVRNCGGETMYFTIGGHPAFNVPADGIGNQSDYSLRFEGLERLTYLLVEPGLGTVKADEEHTLELTGGCCRIDAHMFDRDALVVDSQIEKAEILMPDGTPYVELACKGFPNFGIWSVPGAPYVCLEPWAGRSDNTGFKGELSEKDNVNHAEPGKTFEKEYTITIF